MPVSRVGEREASLVAEATDPVALPEADDAPQRQHDVTQESTEAAAEEERGRSFSHRIGSRAVWLLLAFVVALLVGFGSMTVLLRLYQTLFFKQRLLCACLMLMLFKRALN